MPILMRLLDGRWLLGSLCLALALVGCQPQREAADAPAMPPVGHYEGSISPAGQPEMRAALDIRHPSPGHYEAELTVPTASALNFVADTLLFGRDELRLTRPGRPAQQLSLKLEGDFWRGNLRLDSTQVPTLLVKRGAPTPSTYRVEEVPQANGSAWLFAPADTATPGAALALLPTAETAPTAALWADALAREGLIVLLLPAADSATPDAEAPRLQAALRLLRATPGADTANIGAWAVGTRAPALAQLLTAEGGPRLAFVVAQNAKIDLTNREAFRALRTGRVPLLGLYGGAGAMQGAAAWRGALGGRRGAAVQTYRGTGADLLVPGKLSSAFGPGLPGAVVEWLRGAR